MNINELEDRELDATVAEKVMGWKQMELDGLPEHHWPWIMPNDNRTFTLPNYSTDIAAAWRVVEKMQECGWYFTITTETLYDVTFSCNVRDSKSGTWDSDGTYDRWITKDVRAATAPLAICRAALMADEAE